MSIVFLIIGKLQFDYRNLNFDILVSLIPISYDRMIRMTIGSFTIVEKQEKSRHPTHLDFFFLSGKELYWYQILVLGILGLTDQFLKEKSLNLLSFVDIHDHVIALISSQVFPALMASLLKILSFHTVHKIPVHMVSAILVSLPVSTHVPNWRKCRIGQHCIAVLIYIHLKQLNQISHTTRQRKNKWEISSSSRSHNTHVGLPTIKFKPRFMRLSLVARRPFMIFQTIVCIRLGA